MRTRSNRLRSTDCLPLSAARAHVQPQPRFSIGGRCSSEAKASLLTLARHDQGEQRHLRGCKE
eukprot:1920590-Alexandrium_andersonii.AAC.1